VHGESTVALSGSSSLTVKRGLLACSPDEFEEIWAAMPPPTENPMNPGTEVIRRQGTWGHEYRFGRQRSRCLGPLDAAPAAVRRAVELARAEAVALDIDPALATVAHTNWYEVAKGRVAALGFHQDVDPAGNGLPIMSFTLMSAPPGVAPYRYFVVSADLQGKQRLAALPLGHGDYMAMMGAFQQEFYHGVPSVARKDHIGQRRINITVRFWGVQ
jgi:alkylated DNA repair dioxygenase AlkB